MVVTFRWSQSHKSAQMLDKVQHVRNADLMLECEECGMWRLLYAPHKLQSHVRFTVEDALNGMSFSCGSPLQELDLPELNDKVYVHDLNCQFCITLLSTNLSAPTVDNLNLSRVIKSTLSVTHAETSHLLRSSFIVLVLPLSFVKLCHCWFARTSFYSFCKTQNIFTKVHIVQRA